MTPSRNPDSNIQFEADIKGEVHLSKRDRRELMGFDFEEYDAVFREGKDPDIFDRTLTIGYLVFAIGFLIYQGTFGRIYIPSDEFEQAVIDKNTPFHKIDARIHRIYEMVRWRHRIFYFFVVAPLCSLAIIGLLLAGVISLHELLGLSSLDWILNISLIMTIFILGLVWAFTYFLLIILTTVRKRDSVMAKESLQLSENNQYRKVLISCGDAHREGIGFKLNSHNWEINHYPTKSYFGKFGRLMESLTWNLVHPKHAYHQFRSKIRQFLSFISR